MARFITVYGHPYADVMGTIEIPDNIPSDGFRSYVDDHFDEIQFGIPELDYCGTDYELEDVHGHRC